MDWVMCLLPFAVCFVGFLAVAKVTKTKKKKWILAAAGVVLFLAAAFGSLAVYRNQKITKPIRDSELLAVAELRLDAFLGDAELNDFQTDRLTELYGALGHYLNSLVYLPCINQDTFDAGTQDVILQFGTEEEVKLWLAFYPDRRICLVNGKKAYVFPGGTAAYQKIEAILASDSVQTTVTITALDAANDQLTASDAEGKEYVIHGISEKLRTRDEEQVNVKALSAGDTLTVLSDGAALLSAPSQFAHIYKIYWEK